MIKIGELSNISGVSVKAIRFYEEEGLISPVEVDRWTNYRYYDETSIKRLSEISYLKDLGFSLKEIKNFNDETIKQKIAELKLDITKFTKSIKTLSALKQEKGEYKMKTFINDEQVIGKWKRIAVVKEKEDFALAKFDDENIFDFAELYFLPQGEEYWIFSWTKGTLYLKNREMPYEIINGKLFIGVVDYISHKVENYAVYEKVDSRAYAKDEIEIKDNVDIPFITDERVIGFWQAVDYVHNFEEFKPNKKFWKGETVLSKYTFAPDGVLMVEFIGRDDIYSINWSKGVVINKNIFTVSEYTIKDLEDETYMFVEWKSGDYIYGGEVSGYYVFKKIK